MISATLTSAELAEVRALFRGEINDDPQRGFDRNEQLSISTSRLENLRSGWPHLWQRVHETLAEGQLHGPEHRGVREFKSRIARDIRIADESIDHRATVAFTSLRAARRLLADRKRRLTKGQLQSRALAHEHGVPVEVILRIVVDPQNMKAPLLPILEALSCRSLLATEEVSDIDRLHATSLPIGVPPGPTWTWD